MSDGLISWYYVTPPQFWNPFNSSILAGCEVARWSRYLTRGGERLLATHEYYGDSIPYNGISSRFSLEPSAQVSKLMSVLLPSDPSPHPTPAEPLLEVTPKRIVVLCDGYDNCTPQFYIRKVQ